jgi:hypothetical protein
MNTTASRTTIRAILGGLLMCATVALAGCGSEELPDPCADTTCEFGVCNSEADGTCTNPDACRVDSACLPGYVCGETGECTPENTCESDADCEAGVCESGACLNPETCSENGDCVERTYCGAEGTCEPDPCNHTDCERGVCERGTGECIAADSCTEATAYRDCIGDQQCVGGTCQTEDGFCEQLECETGVCSFEERGCVQPSQCDADEDCFEGYLCDDMDRCVENPCESGEVTCDGVGVCDPATGKCENAETCTRNADCTNSPEHLCVDGTCRLAESACGDADGDGGCPGNQVCQYSEQGLRTSCVEPEQCETSIDCKQGRQCSGRDCVSPASCRPDRFEDNETPDAATDFPGAAKDGALSASLCRQDTDVYSFSTGELVGQEETGQLLVDFHIPRADVGLGTLEATLTGPEGMEVASGSLEPNVDEDHLRLSHELTADNRGEYTLEVAAGSSMNRAGLDYNVSLNVLSQETVDACGDAETLELDELVSGDTTAGGSSGLASSCVPDDGSVPEKIYALQVDRPREVELTATPKFSDVDVSVSIRSRCTEPATEMVCEESSGLEEAESLTTVLGEGSHYVVVQSPDAETAGAFTVKTRGINEKRCTGADNYCSGSVTSNWCLDDGGRFTSIPCELGCNPSTGRCYPPEGNYCGDAPTITENAARGFDLREFTDSFDPAPGGCLGDDPRSGGPDRAYAVDVPSDRAVTVTARYQREVQGSVYLAESCEDAGGTCVTSAQDSMEDPSVERLTYTNRTDGAETRYVVIDSGARQNLAPVEVTFEYEDVTCEPGAKRCGDDSGNQQQCNEFGTGYEQFDACGEWPCQTIDQTSACRRADDCGDVPNVTARAGQQGGTQYTLLWGNYDNSFQGDGTCGGTAGIDGSETGGPDAVFEVDVASGEVLTASVVGNDDYSLYVKESTESPATCGSRASTCLASDSRDGGSTAELSRYFTDGETVYLVVDTAGAEAPSGANVNIDIKPSICTPETAKCGSSGNVQYCEQPGLSNKRFACDGSGCTDGQCDGKTAEHCYAADNITSDLQSGTFSATESWADFTNAYVGSGCGDIGDSDTRGPEAVYRADLEGSASTGEKLTATLSATDGDYSVFITDAAGCTNDFSDSACLGEGSASGGDDARASHTSGDSNETVYIVVERPAGTTGDFTLEAETRTVCSLGSGSCTGGGKLDYCPFSQFTQTLSCSNCCSAASGASAAPNQSTGGLFGSVSDRLQVPSCSSGSISKIIMGVETSGPDGNNSLDLTSPNGTSVELADNGGGCCSDGADATVVYPVQDTPNDSLDAFHGEDPSGTWTLDLAGAFGTTLKKWFVTVSCN